MQLRLHHVKFIQSKTVTPHFRRECELTYSSLEINKEIKVILSRGIRMLTPRNVVLTEKLVVAYVVRDSESVTQSVLV
jgi:hypothetical protein